MSLDAATSDPTPPTAPLSVAHRWIAVLVLGFASGLPLALTGLAMQAWLTMDGLDLAAIGFLTLIGIPYTFKFLWAPLLDRVDLPLLGRRRGWIALTQALLSLALFALADVDPKVALPVFAALGVLVAFLSASQDIVVDAWRVDVLPPRERGFGSSLFVMGYRIAMILSGGIALMWTDTVDGIGMTWPAVYRLMALIMAVLAVCSALALPRLAQPPARVRDASRGPIRQDLAGFLAVLAAVALGVFLTQRFGGPIAAWLLSPWFGSAVAKGSLQAKWIDLLALLLGLAVTLPLAGFAARRARFQTLLAGLDAYFSQPRAWAFLAFIVFYKLTDAFQLSLLTPFLLKGMAFGPAEVGVVNKLIGLLLTVFGALLGGLVMLRLRLAWSLLVFGLLQMSSSLAFWWLAVHGKGVLPGWTIPAFDFGFVKLLHPTQVDGGLLMAVGCENLASGMGTAAFLAFLMSLTNTRFSATQFALLSAFQSVGRVWIGPLAGVLAEAIGWPAFFLVAVVMGVPSLVLLWRLWRPIDALDVRPGTP